MVRKVALGKTGFEVSRLGFGTLPLGRNQANFSVKQGGLIIRYAVEKGINFIDTAAGYGTYHHIREGLKDWDDQVIIATKTPAKTYEEAEKDIREALEALHLERLDILLLHAARSLDPFQERAGCLQCLIDSKHQGIVQAIGVSTHAVNVVQEAAKISEIDVIHPLINKSGLGILGGTAEQMLWAAAEAHRMGKGIYVMKVYGGGHLTDDPVEAFSVLLNKSYLDAFVIGMIRAEEVDINLAIAEGRSPDPDLMNKIGPTTKRLIILSGLCQGCGRCVEICPNQALSLLNEKSTVDHEKCILCGYCIPVCPQFGIRLV